MGSAEVALLETNAFDMPAGADLDSVEFGAFVDVLLAEEIGVTLPVTELPTIVLFCILDGATLGVASAIPLVASDCVAVATS